MSQDSINHVLEPLQGSRCTRVALDQWSATVILDGNALLIESEWVLTDKTNVVVDESTELLSRSEFGLWRIVGKDVKKAAISSTQPYQFILKTNDGWTLTISANDDGYDDWMLGTTNGKIFCNGDDLGVYGG